MPFLHEGRIRVGRAGHIGPTRLKDVGGSFRPATRTPVSASRGRAENDPPTPVRELLAHLNSNIAGG